jgi:predicted transcriptional regulator
MPLPADAQVKQALRQPLRRRLIPVFIENQPLSPREAARLLGESLPSVAYHVRELVKLQFLVLHSREPVRGALKNYYVPNEEILELPSIKELIAKAGKKRS